MLAVILALMGEYEVRGRRWGPEGPPPEAYERVSDPEYYRPLHTVGRELLDELADRFRVRRMKFIDRGRPDGPDAPEPGVLLVPEQSGSASFGLTFTEAPGLVPWRAGRRHGHLPFCACDACDTPLSECLTKLNEIADTVVEGAFGERLITVGDRWWHSTWTIVGPSRHRSESGGPIDDAAAEDLLERLPDGQARWSPWVPRPPALTEPGTSAGRSSGVVRRWSDLAAWGVIDSPDTPGGCWTHYTALDQPGFRTLLPGQGVQLEWERGDQDGYHYRATRVVPESA